MVRVWLRPALVALRRQATKNVVVHASARQALLAQQHLIAVREFASKKDKGYEKKTIHDKVVDIEDEFADVPPDVKEMAKVDLEPEMLQALMDEEFGDLDLDDEDDDDDDDVGVELDESEIAQLEKILAERDNAEEEEFLNDDDDEDSDLTDAEWAAKYEHELASLDAAMNKKEVVDDRLYIEMPNFDPMMGMVGNDMVDKDDEEEGDYVYDKEYDDDGEYDSEDDDDDSDDDDTTPDPYEHWDQHALYTPEMLNWMLPTDKRQPFTKTKDKPWKYFVRANHPDPVELAMDVDLLRLFISPTGRIRPRRYTGLTAKQQRQLARSVKISRQLALLPYLSRYPDPSPEQWRAIDEAEIAKLLAEAENDDGSNDVEDLENEDDAEFAGMDDED